MTDNERNQHIETYQNDVSRFMTTKWIEGKEKYGDAWLDCDPEYMIRRMEEEYYEFRQAVEHDRDTAGGLEELADIVNFGLMFLELAENEDADTP